MAEENEQAEQEVVTSPKIEKPKPQPRSSGGLWLFVIFLLVLGIAGAGYYFLTQLRAKQEGLGGEVKSELTRQINDYQGQLTAIQSQISTLQSEISGKEDHFNKVIKDFTDLQNQKIDVTRKDLEDKVLKVQRQLGRTRGDWLIADAEYLLSVANERLHLVGDVNTSRAALEAADQRLRESGDSGIIPIREQIAKEISQLQGVKPPDVVGLYASIQAMESEVSKLAILLPYSGKPLTPPEDARNADAVSEDGNQLLNSAIEGLEGIVTIKRTDKPVKEILSQEQADFIREQLKVKLEVVKVALVQQNDDLYQSSLADIKKWTTEHFTDNASAQVFMKELASLQAVKLRSQLPNISLSLKMLRDVSKLRVETDKAIGEFDTQEPKPGDNAVPSGTKSPDSKAAETSKNQPDVVSTDKSTQPNK